MAEEQLLGAADEEARFLAHQPFTREIAASVAIKTSFDQALDDLGVPAATLLEALRAFTATVNLQRDIKPGDRLHVRYEQAFTAEGAPIGVGRVLWAELTLASRGPVAIHRFRTRDKVERLWFTNGLSATPPSLRMPLDAISVSSGFGLRADPFDQPPPLAATGKSAPMGGPMRSKPPAARPADRRHERQWRVGQHGHAARRLARPRALRRLRGGGAQGQVRPAGFVHA